MKEIYVGLDVGGTFVRSLAVEELGLQSYPKCNLQKLKKSGDVQREIEDNICAVIDKYINMDRDVKLKGIGISLAALVNRKTGVIKSWPNNPSWCGFNIRYFLQEKYRVPILIEDDANCGALGEYYFGGHMENKNFVYISLGTGVGCGIIINGSIYTGDNGFAGELGHTIIDNTSSSYPCKCGQSGCFQTIVSGPAIVEKYNDIQGVKEAVTVDAIITKALMGEKISQSYIDRIINSMSLGIYNTVMLLDVSQIVIGGGLSQIFISYLSRVESCVNERLGWFNRYVKLGLAKCGENSGVFGALKILEHII